MHQSEVDQRMGVLAVASLGIVAALLMVQGAIPAFLSSIQGGFWLRLEIGANYSTLVPILIFAASLLLSSYSDATTWFTRTATYLALIVGVLLVCGALYVMAYSVFESPTYLVHHAKLFVSWYCQAIINFLGGYTTIRFCLPMSVNKHEIEPDAI
jgi:hypothetical protein